MSKIFFENTFVWFFVAVLLLGVCATLPIKIKDDALRSFAMRWVLVPLSILIIGYVYPMGIEVFRRLAVK